MSTLARQYEVSADEGLPAVPGAWWRALSTPATAPRLPKGLDALAESVSAHVVMLKPRVGHYLRRADRVLALQPQMHALGEQQVGEWVEQLRETFRRGRETALDVERAMALVRELGRRRLGLEAFREQVAAALAMHDGSLVEVATGEGKTLVATMPAVLAGWRGRGCHVVTVNDYLARRDAEWMQPLYAACGLSVGYVLEQMPPIQRRAAYAADITYLTNKNVAADYLRDRLALGGRVKGLPETLLSQMAGRSRGGANHVVMRGLEQVIVDEADACLIDEAVTPLIISTDTHNDEQVQAYEQAAQLAPQLNAGEHYRVDHAYREVRLTNKGKMRLDELTAEMHGVWQGRRRREELVVQALTARELFIRDKHYVVQDGKVVIIDEFTGRMMPDRTWRDGLHQAVEAKEGLTVNPAKTTLARISFQRFFRLYRRRCGMTGTAWSARHEIWRTYRTPTVRIPTHKPCRRRVFGDRIYRDAERRWRVVVDEVRTMHEQGRPVLVGTRSISASEHLSAMLTAEGLDHQVLNATRHAEEAEIVAGAGQGGAITIATNMAGRGTDIKLGPGVAERGGLHVIATERHESRRVDRQLFGRCARQGDPGSAAAILSLGDELLVRYAPRTMLGVLRRMPRPGTLGRLAYRRAQQRAERRGVQQRRLLLVVDDQLSESLGFAGRE